MCTKRSPAIVTSSHKFTNLSTIVSIQDNQSLQALKHDKTERISYKRKIRKNSILSCITWYTSHSM